MLFVAIIALLYVPMVFLGANVFFPDLDYDDLYRKDMHCNQKYRLTGEMPQEERERVSAELDACLEEAEELRKEREEHRRWYEGWKYVFITAFNLVILLFAVFAKFLRDRVTLGLFLGAVIATFFSTIEYMRVRSKLGFGILVVLFVFTVWFINKKARKK